MLEDIRGNRNKRGSNLDSNSWAISFGDMVTFLLVFFIVVASAAEVSSAKFERLKKALTSEPGERTSIDELQENLEKILKKHELEEYVDIEAREDGVHVSIKNELLFSSASAKISETNRIKITPILAAFHDLPKSYRFSIEGHTDDVPISSDQYPSNWHLSTQRALSILDIFKENDFRDKRLRVQGFADQKPVVPNIGTKGEPIEKNRKKNRRAVIRIF